MLLVIFASGSSSFARNGTHFRYGVEWGGALSLFSIEHYNYLTPDGPRINVNETSFDVWPLGFLSISAGVATGSRWATDFLLGYHGIRKGRILNSLRLRETFYPAGMGSDGFNFFAQAGPGWGGTLKPASDICAALGGGYRWVLSRSFSLEAHLSLDAFYDHPSEIIDRAISKPVDISHIRRSNVMCGTLQAGVSIFWR